MYAAIGSYIARCWRLFDFRFTRHPPLWATVLLAIGIYVNFFAHHYVWDARVLLFALTTLLLGRCWVHFKVWRVHRRMPLLIGFALVALFIWLAENIGTFTAAWAYPNQRHGWQLVSFGKLGAWFLLMIISYVLVALVNRPQVMPRAEATQATRVPDPPVGFLAAPVVLAVGTRKNAEPKSQPRSSLHPTSRWFPASEHGEPAFRAREFDVVTVVSAAMAE
jgi:hypothetical protein